MNYGVAKSRERCVYLLSRMDSKGTRTEKSVIFYTHHENTYGNTWLCSSI